MAYNNCVKYTVAVCLISLLVLGLWVYIRIGQNIYTHVTTITCKKENLSNILRNHNVTVHIWKDL